MKKILLYTLFAASSITHGKERTWLRLMNHLDDRTVTLVANNANDLDLKAQRANPQESAEPHRISKALIFKKGATPSFSIKTNNKAIDTINTPSDSLRTNKRFSSLINKAQTTDAPTIFKSYGKTITSTSNIITCPMVEAEADSFINIHYTATEENLKKPAREREISCSVQPWDWQK